MNKKIILGAAACAVFAILTAFPAPSFGQEEETNFDSSKIPSTAESIEGFVPEGWNLEEKVTGDVNGDGVADHLLKIIDSKPETADEGEMGAGNRVLIIVFADKEGNLRRAAVAPSVLQCASCGGAFYGAGNAPANVSIKNGVIIVEQDYGSRWVSEMTFRFRYDAQPEKFILIGFDYTSRDRAEGNITSESTNYLTGKRITSVSKVGRKAVSTTTNVAKDRMSIEEVDRDKFDEDANVRLGL